MCVTAFSVGGQTFGLSVVLCIKKIFRHLPYYIMY